MKGISLVLFLLLFAGGVWGDEEEGLSRQEIRFLDSIERIDKKNEALGESLPFETRVKIIESMTDMLQEGLSVSSGLAMINITSKGTEMTTIYRANVDISNYGKEEIRDLQEFLLNRFKQATCSAPLNRALMFVLDLTAQYEFIDIRNSPFGGKMEFNKADCKGIKTIGRPMIYPKALLKVIVEEESS